MTDTAAQMVIPQPYPLSSIAPTGALCYPGYPHCWLMIPMIASMWGGNYQFEPKPTSPPPPAAKTDPQQQCGPGMHALFEGVACGTDAQCQTLATGFFCYHGHCCAQSNPPASGYGSACTLAEHCKFSNSACIGNICYCSAGHGYNGQECVAQGAYEPTPIPNAGCSLGQVSINGRCYPLSGYGGFCDFTRQCAYPGGLCYQQRCVCPPEQLYNGQMGCAQDPNIPAPAPGAACPPGFIFLNGVCLPLVGLGQPCQQDLQCRGMQGEPAGMHCSGGVCRYATPALPPLGPQEPPRAWDVTPAQRAFPLCRNPLAEVDLASQAIPKDCIYQKCSPGYHCEWNALYKGGQYICCGTGPENPIWGQPKMYTGHANLPVKCTALNSCQFVDYPYCVYSESYRHKVCCSRPQCL